MEQFTSSSTQRNSQEQGRIDLREMGVCGGEEIGKWWTRKKRNRKEIKERKGNVIENRVKGKKC